MSKNIVFCADGTWNGPGEDDKDGTEDVTNVFKLFSNLAGEPKPDAFTDEQERSLIESGAVLQVTKYLHGVGDSGNLLVKILGGAFGSGLITRIVRGYTFISRNYVPGDKIFLVGFSRGAYTARALAGLISKKGLLDAAKLDLNDKVDGYRYGLGAWYDYRHEKLQSSGFWLDQLRAVAASITGFMHFMLEPPDDALVPAPIEAAGVWDTVGALGIPEYNARLIRRDVFQFADLKLSPVVKCGFHAVAVDEMRIDFTPTLWDADPRVTQILFVGGHCDVGGGYPDCAQSDAALKWMTGELAKRGALFSSTPDFSPQPNPKGIAHAEWEHIPWNKLLRGSRNFPKGLALHQGVLDRIAAGKVVADPGDDPGAYSPSNLAAYVIDRAAAPGVTVIA
jgi:uncharacterized protein (DUF2235 family)